MSIVKILYEITSDLPKYGRVLFNTLPQFILHIDERS